jgi:hypothetical protein
MEKDALQFSHGFENSIEIEALPCLMGFINFNTAAQNFRPIDVENRVEDIHNNHYLCCAYTFHNCISFVSQFRYEASYYLA